MRLGTSRGNQIAGPHGIYSSFASSGSSNMDVLVKEDDTDGQQSSVWNGSKLLESDELDGDGKGAAARQQRTGLPLPAWGTELGARNTLRGCLSSASNMCVPTGATHHRRRRRRWTWPRGPKAKDSRSCGGATPRSRTIPARARLHCQRHFRGRR